MLGFEKSSLKRFTHETRKFGRCFLTKVQRGSEDRGRKGRTRRPTAAVLEKATHRPKLRASGIGICNFNLVY